jgi:hypothetical protein
VAPRSPRPGHHIQGSKSRYSLRATPLGNHPELKSIGGHGWLRPGAHPAVLPRQRHRLAMKYVLVLMIGFGLGYAVRQLMSRRPPRSGASKTIAIAKTCGGNGREYEYRIKSA